MGCNAPEGYENGLIEKDSSTITDSTQIIPIVSANYNRYILVKNTSEDYIKSMTSEYGELAGTEGDHYVVEFGILKIGNWFMIEVPQEIDFYDYHNLVGWYTGYEENPNIPDFSIGFAESIESIDDSYVFYLDPNNEFGDTHIGVFKNDTKFSIYLPDAYEENGNITVNNGLPINFTMIDSFLTANNFTPPPKDDMNFKKFEVKIYE